MAAIVRSWWEWRRVNVALAYASWAWWAGQALGYW